MNYKENTCNYSDEWQKYIGDYDKFEYDITLKNGDVIENCYPNAGKFNSVSNKHLNKSFDESDVDLIRFSHSPIFCINGRVSKIKQINKNNNLLRKYDSTDRIYQKVYEYMSGKYSLNDVYEQILNKTCKLPFSCRKYVLNHYDEKGNYKYE